MVPFNIQIIWITGHVLETGIHFVIGNFVAYIPNGYWHSISSLLQYIMLCTIIQRRIRTKRLFMPADWCRTLLLTHIGVVRTKTILRVYSGSYCLRLNPIRFRFSIYSAWLLQNRIWTCAESILRINLCTPAKWNTWLRLSGLTLGLGMHDSELMTFPNISNS